ncbi:MAG: TRAP transporter small permease [Spirochaetales bacterium]
MKKLFDKIAELQLFLASVLFFIIFLVNMLEIVSRSAFNRSFLWVSDFSVICVVWMICLAMAACIHLKEHLFMDFLAKKLPLKIRQALNVIISFTMFAFFVMLFFTGIQTAMTKTSLIFPSIQWSIAWSFSALPVFAFFAALFMVPRIFEIIKGKDPHEGVELESIF